MSSSPLYGLVWSVVIDVDDSTGQRRRLERLLSEARSHVLMFQHIPEERGVCGYSIPHHHFIVWCHRSVWGEFVLPSVMRDPRTRVALAETGATLDVYFGGQPLQGCVRGQRV